MRRHFLILSVFTLSLAGALWPAAARAQWGYPPPYGGAYDATADVRLQVTPKQAEVYVDGYYAGIVDDFDGFFQRLHVPPGNHELTLYLAGYRTAHQELRLSPRSTYKLHFRMEPLGAGETSEPPPAAKEPPAGEEPPQQGPPQGPPPRMARPPRGPDWRRPMPPPPGPEEGAFGTLVIRVQPADAEILIDGEPWNTSGGDARLLVQVAEGSHHVEIRKDGYVPYSTDVDVRRGETRPINVSLSRERE